MNTDPQSAEMMHLIQQTHEMVIQIAKEQNQIRGELIQLNERIGSLETRMTALETRVAARLTTLETRMSDLETRMSKEIREIFKWLIAMMLPVWLGLIAALIIQLLMTA